MPLLITGATGHLGRLVVEQLLAAGVPAGDIIATGRATDKIKDLADRGVQVRAVDFADPAAVRAAVADADRVLLVSAMDPGGRVAQHRNVIDAARDAGTGLVAYTSIVNAATTTIRLAADHQATEQARDTFLSAGTHFKVRYWHGGKYGGSAGGAARRIRRVRAGLPDPGAA